MTYAVVGGVLLALLAIVWLAVRTAEQKGRSESDARRLQEAASTARRANEIDEDVRRLADSDLDRELRNGGS